MVICLQQGADCLYKVQLIPLHPKTSSSLASFTSRLVLPFWYQLTQVVLEKRQLNRTSSSSSSTATLATMLSHQRELYCLVLYPSNSNTFKTDSNLNRQQYLSDA